MRRLAWLAIAGGSVGCGIFFEPGGLLGGGEPAVTTEAGADTGAADRADAAGDADASASGETRVVLVGGRREPLPGETGGAFVAETLRVTVSRDGALGAWQFDAPPPVATAWTKATLAGGVLFVHDASRYARVAFAERVGGGWTTAAIPAEPALAGLRPWLLSEHGFLSGAPLAPASMTSRALRFTEDGGLGSWVEGAAVSVERTEVTLARAGGLVYAVGGRRVADADATATSDVEVAPLDGNGTLGAFTKVSDLGLRKDTGTLVTVYAPVVATGAGRIVVLGGTAALPPAAEPSDGALAASILDPNAGTLGDWTELPRLPAALTGFAAVVTSHHVLVFGGETATGVSAAVLALDVLADGTYGAAWRSIGTLPGPRSGIVGVTY